MKSSEFSRRAFLAAPAILAAQTPSDTVRVAVIGVGNRGSYLLRTIMKAPGVQIVALCDIDPENLQRAMNTARPRATSPRVTRNIASCSIVKMSMPW
jgi:predicted homoserine dehydrogenase-like protein